MTIWQSLYLLLLDADYYTNLISFLPPKTSVIDMLSIPPAVIIFKKQKYEIRPRHFKRSQEYTLQMK